MHYRYTIDSVSIVSTDGGRDSYRQVW